MTCGPTLVQAKPFTEWEWNNIRPYVGFRYGDGESLAKRIEATMCQGFAPDEPTDEEINAWAARELCVHWHPHEARPTNSLTTAMVCAREARLGCQINVEPTTGLTQVYVSGPNREDRLNYPVWKEYHFGFSSMARAIMTKVYKLKRKYEPDCPSTPYVGV